MNITSRSEWGARHQAGFGSRRVGSLAVYLHHSVTVAPTVDASPEAEQAAMRTLENIGQARFKGGISYTFAVMPSGRVYEGTGVDRVGSHTGGRNSTTVGIVLVGNYDVAEPSSQMLAGVASLLRHGAGQWWAQPRLNGGHRDVATTGTACPGRHAYARIGQINALAAVGGGGGYSAPAAPTQPAAPTGLRNSDGSLTIAEDGIRGAATIARWQEVMGTPIDGVISRPSTLIAADQRFLNAAVDDVHVRNLTGRPTLSEDGLEGPNTIKVRQFLLYNIYGPQILGRGARAADFDGILGPQTNRLHQAALNRATARTARYA